MTSEEAEKMFAAVRRIMPWVNYAAKGFIMDKFKRQAIETLNEMCRAKAKGEPPAPQEAS